MSENLDLVRSTLEANERWRFQFARRAFGTSAGESRTAREVQLGGRKVMDPIAYITVTDHEAPC